MFFLSRCLLDSKNNDIKILCGLARKYPSETQQFIDNDYIGRPAAGMSTHRAVQLYFESGNFSTRSWSVLRRHLADFTNVPTYDSFRHEITGSDHLPQSSEVQIRMFNKTTKKLREKRIGTTFSIRDTVLTLLDHPMWLNYARNCKTFVVLLNCDGWTSNDVKSFSAARHGVQANLTLCGASDTPFRHLHSSDCLTRVTGVALASESPYVVDLLAKVCDIYKLLHFRTA